MISSQIGAVRCAPDHPDFEDPGPVQRPAFLFPRSSIWVRRVIGRPFIADPTMVTFYNGGEMVRRKAVTGRGDDHEWFAFQPQVYHDVLRELFPQKERPWTEPFTFQRGPLTPEVHVRQRILFELLRCRPDHLSSLQVEESALELAGAVVRSAGAESQRPVSESSVSVRSRDRVEAVKEILAERYKENLSLGDLGRMVGCSEFHLARMFRRFTGQSLHQHRMLLRLTAALEAVLDGERDLTALALRLGFSSHSHLTMTFRTRFGQPPSKLRRLPLLDRLPAT